MFLIYSGVFLDRSNPSKIAEYYYDCAKNWEWFLTYQIYERGKFDFGREMQDYNSHKFYLIKKIVLETVELKEPFAVVQAAIFYKNGTFCKSNMELKKNGRNWKILNITYNK